MCDLKPHDVGNVNSYTHNNSNLDKPFIQLPVRNRIFSDAKRMLVVIIEDNCVAYNLNCVIDTAVLAHAVSTVL